jgi:uncharacterized protein (UPF0261 family)
LGNVVLIGTLDTKGAEYAFLRDCLTEAGATTTLVDVGILGDPDDAADIPATEVAAAAGAALASLRHSRWAQVPPGWCRRCCGRGAATPS